MTVYITQDSIGRSFIAAQKHGDLVALLPSEAQVTLSSGPTLRKLRRGLKSFGDEDFLLLSGDPIIMGLAIVVALEGNRGKGKFLKWDNREKDYYIVLVDLYEKGEAL